LKSTDLGPDLEDILTSNEFYSEISRKKTGAEFSYFVK